MMTTKKTIALTLLLFMSGHATAGASFTGTWFACDTQFGEYEILEITESKSSYSGILELSRNGGVYAAEVSGTANNNQLQLRGCMTYRGEVMPQCDISAPPVLAVLSSPSTRPDFIRISKSAVEREIQRCAKKLKAKE